MTKTDALTEKRQVEEQLKQEEKKHEAEAAKEKVVSPEAKSPKPAKPVEASQKTAKVQTQQKDVKPAVNAAKPADKKEAVKEEKKREIVLERVALIPLRIAFAQEKADRRHTASRLVREYAARHFKVDSSMVRISTDLAALALGSGALRTARSVKARISKDKEGVVLVEMVKA